MRRRDVLLLSAAALVCDTLPASAKPQAINSAAEIGRWLIQNRLIPADRAALSSSLGSACTPVAARQAIQADFAAGRTVSVDGWVISETEARLCALAALSMHQRAGV